MKITLVFIFTILLFGALFAAMTVKNVNIDLDFLTQQIEKMLQTQYGNLSDMSVSVSGFNTSFNATPADILAYKNITNPQGQPVQNASKNGTDSSGTALLVKPKSPALPFLGQDLRKQVINVAIILAILCYIFAAGKIADFLQSSGKAITKKEALFAPFAYFATSALLIIIYISSGFFAPPQSTPITLGFFLIIIPSLIALVGGTAALYYFFRDRMNIASCFSLSIRIIFAPLFDGIKGYWTALGGAAIVGVISTISFFSSGGNMALATTDFLFLSITVSLYFVYKAAVAMSNEDRATNLTTFLFILSPSIIKVFARDIACAAIGAIPIKLFATCPLSQSDQQTSLALSLAATFIVLLPLIPIAYAALVNTLRAATVLKLLFAKDAVAEKK